MENPILSVIIVSFNTRQITLDCLKALYADLGALRAEVLVVDNASADGSADAIRAAFPEVVLIANDRNAGFGAANNLALRRAAGRFLLLLNSDAFVRPGALRAMIAYLEAHPEAGVVGPRLLNGDGSLQRSCFRLPSPLRAWLDNLGISELAPGHSALSGYGRWPHDSTRHVEFVSGACMCVRRETYDAVGGFDERFFMYAEESDWQRRIRDRGWQIAFHPDAVVTHLGGASGAGTAARVNPHFFASLDYFIWKHHGPVGLAAVRLAMCIGCFVRTIAWAVILAAVPARREVAAARARLMSRLCWRQATYWKLDCLKGRGGA
jgi:GT2 family glycosyltransferase